MAKKRPYFAPPSNDAFVPHFFAYKILSFNSFEKLTADSCSHYIELSNEMRFIGDKAI